MINIMESNRRANQSIATTAAAGYHLEIDSGEAAPSHFTNNSSTEFTRGTDKNNRSSKLTNETACPSSSTTHGEGEERDGEEAEEEIVFYEEMDVVGDIPPCLGGGGGSTSNHDATETEAAASRNGGATMTTAGGTNHSENGLLKVALKFWFPGPSDVERCVQDPSHAPHVVHIKEHPRSIRRRCFLFITEPESSILSAVLFGLIIFAVSLMNVIMIMQTMAQWQFTPTDCITCGGDVMYVFDDKDITKDLPPNVPCICPPAPEPWTEISLHWMVNFFAVEWFSRVLLFEPPSFEKADTKCGFFRQWFGFLCSTSVVLDALAVFPYYIETLSSSNGLMSLRLLRLFRVLQLVRFGQYNKTFTSFTTVLYKSVPYFKIMMGILVFGAAFFGSMVYWLEKGHWQYYPDTGDFQFVRKNIVGGDEISPYTSIPSAFWWFFVTATAVGYGDMYPTTSGGRWVSTFAMLMGVLVVAFPVSIFSDLWSNELRKQGALDALDALQEDDDDDSSSSGGSGSINDRGNNNRHQQHQQNRIQQNGDSNHVNHHHHILQDEERGRFKSEEAKEQDGEDGHHNTAAADNNNKATRTQSEQAPRGPLPPPVMPPSTSSFLHDYHNNDRRTTTDGLPPPPSYAAATTMGVSGGHHSGHNSGHNNHHNNSGHRANAPLPTLAGGVELDEHYMVLHKDDIMTLVTQMQLIHESQRQIKTIMKKYKQSSRLSSD